MHNAFSIDPALALVSGFQYFRNRGGSAFHGAIADTAPDGWARRVILRDHAKRRRRSAMQESPEPPEFLDAIDMLSAVDDLSRIGALRICDSDGNFLRTVARGESGIPPLIELAQLVHAARAFESHDETAADLAFLRGRGTSLGGMRPKCSIIDRDGRLAIGKFPSIADERPVTKGEVLALRLAKRAGIHAAQARIEMSAELPVAVIRRFDRDENGERLMYISAATMLGADPGNPSDHTYTEIVDAIRLYGDQVTVDIEELWRRIAFSILITNVDDHIVNHGFLYAREGRWRLSPAFDLNPFPERARELKTWISHESGPDASVDALRSVLPYFHITPVRAREIAQEVESSVAVWREEATALAMNRNEIEAFEYAFEHKERQEIKRFINAR